MKRARVTVCLVLLGLLVVGFFTVPLPVSRIRDKALIQVRSNAIQKVFPVPGILEKLYVHDGQHVYQGDKLAEFSSLELESQLAEAESQYEISSVDERARRTLLNETKDSQERRKLDVARAEAAGKRRKAAADVALLRRAMERLVLRAPRSGVVMGTPKKDEVGKLWDKDQDTPFCSIGDPHRLRVLLPVSPADYRLLKDDMETARRKGRELWVTIRVLGLENQTWRGQIGTLPQSEAKDIPPALSAQAGGPLAVKPGSRPNTLVPTSQQYLVPINFTEQDSAICPGVLAQVKIHCEWRSAAWWVWRAVNKTFDLGLI